MKNIVIFTGVYLPGYKGGGPIKSIKNIVNTNREYFNYHVITSDRDLGDSKPYDNIDINEWNYIDGTKVLYINKEMNLKKQIILIRNKIKELNIDINLYYMNSLFSFDSSILPILLIKLGFIKKSRILIAPRGELDFGALQIKKIKKKIFLTLSNSLKLYKGVSWHGTCESEVACIEKNIKDVKSITSVSNLSNIENISKKNMKEKNFLRCVFLSRITSKKNLLYAIELINNFGLNVTLDIYGTIEDKSYWNKCLHLINNPEQIRYKGSLNPNDVVKTLSEYDLFLFPTKGENFGHVICEALNANIPVLISNNTPWNDINECNCGWTFDLNSKNEFLNKIRELIDYDEFKYNYIKKDIIQYINKKLKNNQAIDEMMNMFNLVSK